MHLEDEISVEECREIAITDFETDAQRGYLGGAAAEDGSAAADGDLSSLRLKHSQLGESLLELASEWAKSVLQGIDGYEDVLGAEHANRQQAVAVR